MNDALDDFVEDLTDLIDKYNDLNYAEILGAIELVKFDLMNETIRDDRFDNCTCDNYEDN